jgi:hypothetical protein
MHRAPCHTRQDKVERHQRALRRAIGRRQRAGDLGGPDGLLEPARQQRSHAAQDVQHVAVGRMRPTARARGTSRDSPPRNGQEDLARPSNACPSGSTGCTGPASFGRLRELARPFGCTAAAVRSSVRRSRSVAMRSCTVSKLSSTELNYDRVLATVSSQISSTRRNALLRRAIRIGFLYFIGTTMRHMTRSAIWWQGSRKPWDGFVGIFDGPARAVRCAAAIAHTIAPSV